MPASLKKYFGILISHAPTSEQRLLTAENFMGNSMDKPILQSLYMLI